MGKDKKGTKGEAKTSANADNKKPSRVRRIKEFVSRQYGKIQRSVIPFMQNKHIRVLLVTFICASFVQLNLVYFVISCREYALTELGEALCDALLETYFEKITCSKLDLKNDIYIVERNKPRRCGRFHKSKL